ncbi:hypothetical protein BU14_0238s0018 [Porphyra umbilicalis]|uniref:Uncharacterized protein n=1 Tax=Porphyra umbilicalis TaxID=2786 RepID=A0A1X6P3Q4_PORUM|nr:hypothetical protein BU14_0238s0018 [Porphyra umbilicalis]|eukprot:OSX75395.1 hypothetical protein BU14_0238s0018 [Porphyra umbilicalis]
MPHRRPLWRWRSRGSYHLVAVGRPPRGHRLQPRRRAARARVGRPRLLDERQLQVGHVHQNVQATAASAAAAARERGRRRRTGRRGGAGGVAPATATRRQRREKRAQVRRKVGRREHPRRRDTGHDGWHCSQLRVVVVKVVLPTSVSYSLGSPYLLIYPQRHSCRRSDPAHAPPRPTGTGRAPNVHPPVARPPRPSRRRSSRSALTAPPRGALSACRGSARCDLPRTQSPGRPSGRPSPRRGASPSPTECRLAMMSARHVRPTLAFYPRMQGRIKSARLPKSAATTKSDIYGGAASRRGGNGQTGGGGAAPPRPAAEVDGEAKGV